MTLNPVSQAVWAGETAIFQLTLTGTLPNPLDLTATLPPTLSGGLSDTTITLPASVTLSLTDSHPPGPLLPGLWYDIPLTASDGSTTESVTARLLVGGYRNYLPTIYH